jgi:hypothetical protein
MLLLLLLLGLLELGLLELGLRLMIMMVLQGHRQRQRAHGLGRLPLRPLYHLAHAQCGGGDGLLPP